MTDRFKAKADGWRSIVGMSDEMVANRIWEDRIDILVDLASHTAENRLPVFARKPAPVQVTYLAYPSTTGLDTIDYRITDPYLDPSDSDSFYSEESIHLPETYWCYRPISEIATVNPLPALSAGHITFGCLNNFSKVTAQMLTIWCSLLQSVPGSHFLIHTAHGNHRLRIEESARNAGIDLHRLRFVELLPLREYFGLYHQIDLALDPFPFAGGTTTCDALWMGVPVVSLAGATAVSRGGLSLLSNIGLPEFVAQTEQEYLRIAVDAANDLHRLAHLRATLRERMRASPLMDEPRFARHIETAYRTMWERWCAKTERVG
jgi:predicted O-linked N-acetylglucosamine transferase (SPINDLY family)